MLHRLFFTLFLLLCISANAGQSSLQGIWKIEWPCNTSSKRCIDGDRDFFALSLAVSGNSICGFHTATSGLFSSVDEGESIGKPSIGGTIQGTSAKLNFQSAWGATGTATIELIGDNKLLWNITSVSRGNHLLPKNETLIKQTTEKNYAINSCFK